MAIGAVHQYLVRGEKRTQIGLVLEAAEPREVHHFCMLFGYGADAVNPYLAFEAMWMLQADGSFSKSYTQEDIVYNYIKAVEKRNNFV